MHEGEPIYLDDVTEISEWSSILQKAKENENLLTPELLNAILTSPEFGNQAAEAIRRTDTFIKDGFTFGQEHGFGVYADVDRSFQITPLFEGGERSIKVNEQAYKWKRANNISGREVLSFHTHPNIYESVIFDTIFGRPTAQRDYFSGADLEIFQLSADLENIGYVDVLGLKDRKKKTGKLVFISFQNPREIGNFDPAAVYANTRNYKIANRNKVPLSVYRQAGLNATQLTIDLQSSTPLNPNQVARVSRILTRRNGSRF